MKKKHKQFSRMKYFMDPDDYLFLVDQEGNSSFFKILRTEPMGKISIMFAISTPGAGGAVAGKTVGAPAPGGMTDWLECTFLEPQYENKVFQVRPYIYGMFDDSPPVGQNPGALIPLNLIPERIELEWELDAGQRRGGTVRKKSVQLNGVPIAAAEWIGGTEGGSIPAPLIPSRPGDLSEVFDMWLTKGNYPRIRVVNNSPVNLGKPGDPALNDFGDEWYLGFIGMKYIVGDVDDDELLKLSNRKLDYRGATIGGLPLTTKKA